MTRFRDVVMSEVFARVVVAFMFAWVLIVWTAWQHDAARVDHLERARSVDLRRWQVIADKCTTNERGGLACPDGVLTTTTTTTTIKEAR